MGLTLKYRVTGRIFHLLLILSALAVVDTLELKAQENLRNSADLYRSYAPIKCSFKSILAGDSVEVYARLKFVQPPADSLVMDFSQLDQSNKESTNPLSLNQALSQQNGNYIFKWVYPKNETPLDLSLRVFIHPRAWIFRHFAFFSGFN